MGPAPGGPAALRLRRSRRKDLVLLGLLRRLRGCRGRRGDRFGAPDRHGLTARPGARPFRASPGGPAPGDPVADDRSQPPPAPPGRDAAPADRRGPRRGRAGSRRARVGLRRGASERAGPEHRPRRERAGLQSRLPGTRLPSVVRRDAHGPHPPAAHRAGADTVSLDGTAGGPRRRGGRVRRRALLPPDLQATGRAHLGAVPAPASVRGAWDGQARVFARPLLGCRLARGGSWSVSRPRYVALLRTITNVSMKPLTSAEESRASTSTRL